MDETALEEYDKTRSDSQTHQEINSNYTRDGHHRSSSKSDAIVMFFCWTGSGTMFNTRIVWSAV